MTYEEFCAEHGIEIGYHRALPERTDRAAEDWDRKAHHFEIGLEIGGREFWRGQYSVGRGWSDRWAREGCKLPKRERDRIAATNRSGIAPMNDQTARNAWAYLDHKRSDGRGMTLHDEKHWQTIWARYGALCPIGAHEVLQSLAMDATGSDQPFADWASDLGFSDDSIKAKAIWETCNDIRRNLVASLPSSLWECEE